MDVGVEFNQYRVVEHIGRGGMADVWSARDTRLNRTVAIKTIVRDLSQDVEPVKLFEREAQTIAQLEHPHILPIYDFGEYDNQLYIVMRFVTGGSLEELLNAGPLVVEEVLRYAKAIAGALDYAHASNIIHLDLKPSNILLDSNNSPYLADFGLATVLGPEGRAANPGFGTLLYMAPEQLTSSVIDHRADIYSFCIMLYHMFTGELPFNATTSLALKQLQMQEDLPELEKMDVELAEVVLPILRRGTALLPESRPSTLIELVRDLEEALIGTPSMVMDLRDTDEYGIGYDEPTFEISGIETDVVPQDVAVKEAMDIYKRAKKAWANGQGRFLLGVTHFMLMNDYYMQAEQYKLTIDESGLQMLLRGALEYGHEIDYWWGKQDDESRRWVALHAIRSENAPARVRAFYRLETLRDSEPPRIPTLVAQSLTAESNEAAKLAAVHVLGTRAQKVHFGSGSYAVVEPPSGLTGRLLTVRTRAGIQANAFKEWRDVVYNHEIDQLLAMTALDFRTPAVAELAARMIGRIRSRAAVAYIADEQRRGSKDALRALALVRDEAPSLPSDVSVQGRFYAWVANTWRRVSDQPLKIVWRFIFALLGGALAMGTYVYVAIRPSDQFVRWLNPNMWERAIGLGLIFGMALGFLALAAGEFPARLRGFWPWWMRLLTSAVLGFLLGTLIWVAFTWLFLHSNIEAGQESGLMLAGVGVALGFVLTAMFNLRGWVAFLVTLAATYIPLLLTWQNYWYNGAPWAVLYVDFDEQYLGVVIPIVIIIAIGSHAQALWADIMTVWRKIRASQKARSAT